MPPEILAVCLDCGDTLIDESTEIKTDGDVSLGAKLIPGADKLMHQLKDRGYPLALVADGPAATFYNNLHPHGLYDLFDVYSISEQVGVHKPDSKIFLHALNQLNIQEQDYGRVIMVGNYLARDIKGANQLGLISVWLDWAPRRPKTPAEPMEEPDYTITSPGALLRVIDLLEGTNKRR